MKRRLRFAAAALVLGTIAAIALVSLAEGAARFYVYFIAQQGKLFRPDPVLGWAPIPNLDLKRRNADGEIWHIRTSARGFRSARDEFAADAERRVVVLGDSFVFGQGVELEDRFDSLIAQSHPSWSFVNRGVMGYGTDQELIAARDLIPQLQDGDLIVLVTSLTDFVDVLGRSQSGRSKPWFEISEGELIEHPPEIGLAEQLRDRSYVLARLFLLLSPDPGDYEPAQLRVSEHLYRKLVIQETAAAVSRGVRVLIAHHGTHPGADPTYRPIQERARASLSRTCATPGIRCVPLDRTLAAGGRAFFQSDAHWNAAGNAAVAKTLAAAIEETIAAPSDS